MNIDGWKYYNHAAIPDIPPHERVDITPIKNRSIWKMEGKPLFVRWSENFDCGYKTEWWYCIKDKPFNFEQVKSKRRNEIRKGLKLNKIEVVKASDYVEDIYRIQSECYEEYPNKYRPHHSFETTKKSCEIWDKNHIVYIAFSEETSEVMGFACIEPIKDYVNYEILKVPNRNKNFQVVAALTYTIIIDTLNTKKYKYICDGARNLVHETNFMSYLIKQFDFRLAYCDLKMEYRPIIKPIIKILYPFRNLINRYSKSRILYMINAVLKMEYISRKCKKEL